MKRPPPRPIVFQETRPIPDLLRIVMSERTELHLLVSHTFATDAEAEAIEPVFLRHFSLVRKEVTRVLGQRPTRGSDVATWRVGDTLITLRVDQEDRGLPMCLLLSSDPVAPAPVRVSDLVPLTATLPRLLQLSPLTLAEALEFLHSVRYAANVSTTLIVSEKDLQAHEKAVYYECFLAIGRVLDGMLTSGGRHTAGSVPHEEHVIVWPVASRSLALTIGHAFGSISMPLWISLRGNT